MDIVTLGAALNGSAEYVNSHFKGGSNIQIVNNPDGTQTINASGEVSAEDAVARADIAAIKDGETLDSFGDVETALGSKQETISDLSTIRSGAALGATAVQPAALSDYQPVISDLDTIRAGAAAGATAVQPADMTTALATKQDALTAAQLNAANSGITSTDVAQITTNKNNISLLNAAKMVFATKGYYLSQLNWTAMGTGMYYCDAESVTGISKIYAVSYTGASNLRTTDMIVPTASENNTKVRLLANTDTFANTNATVTITIIGIA